jgi:hypothetical protein
MISLEVDLNLLLLGNYHKEVTELTTSNRTVELQARQIASESTELRPPIWSHKMWESQMHLLPTALTVDEIKQVHRHHTLLDTTTALQAEAYIREPQRKEEEEKAAKGKAWENFGPHLTAELGPVKRGTELKKTMDEILHIGNPVKTNPSVLRKIARRFQRVIPPKRTINDVGPKQIVPRVLAVKEMRRAQR